ncbi:MAG: hypothetical protein P8N25_01685 [Alphaproteobacteria bacterium]|nr:hypothetical protein [Alphaproteobacteria bacterium]
MKKMFINKINIMIKNYIFIIIVLFNVLCFYGLYYFFECGNLKDYLSNYGLLLTLIFAISISYINNTINNIREQSKFAFEKSIGTVTKAFNLIDDNGIIFKKYNWSNLAQEIKIINELNQDIILNSHRKTYTNICKLLSDKYDLYKIFRNEYYYEDETMDQILKEHDKNDLINKDDLLIVYSFIEHFKEENVNSIKFEELNNIEAENQELGYYFNYISSKS